MIYRLKSLSISLVNWVGTFICVHNSLRKEESLCFGQQ